jgi:hypothetical protein
MPEVGTASLFSRPNGPPLLAEGLGLHVADRIGRNAAVAHDLRIVGERWRHRLQLHPPRGLAHPVNHLLGYSNPHKEQLARVAAAPLRQDNPALLGIPARTPTLFLAVLPVG